MILITSCILFAACDYVTEDRQAAVHITKQFQYPNGLVVGVPQGFTARQIDGGFVIEPEGDSNLKIRRPIFIYVSPLKDAPAVQDSILQRRPVAGKEIHYRIEKSAGGSGGDTYTPEAYEAVPDGLIKYSQAMQSEDQEPDFALCWSIIQATRFGATNR